MFKLGSFTDEISQDLGHACEVCVQYGVKGAEIRRAWEVQCQDMNPGQVKEVKRIVDDHGLTICSLATSFGKCDLYNPEEVAQHMDMLRRCGDIAHEWGCQLVRGFAFWDRDQVAQKPWDDIFRAYEPVPGILEEKDITLGLENEAATFVGTAGHARHLLDHIKCPRIKATWDPANHVQDPQGTDIPTFPDGYGLLKPDIVHVHVKDAAPAGDGTVPNVFLGMGRCHWEAQLQALKDDEYTGYISLETHVRPGRFPADFQAKYGHHLIGENREPASRVCLAWLGDAIAGLA